MYKIIDRSCDIASVSFGEPAIGSQWVSLAAEHVAYLVQKSTEIKESFKSVAIPDECYKQILLLNAFPDQIIECNLRFIVWNHPGHPNAL